MSLGVMNVLPCHDERSGWPEPTRPTRPWGAGSGAQEAGCRAVAYSRRLATLAGNLPSIATALQFHPVWKPRTLFWIQEVNRGKELNGEQVPWDTLPPDGQMAMRTGLWVDRAPNALSKYSNWGCFHCWGSLWGGLVTASRAGRTAEPPVIPGGATGMGLESHAQGQADVPSGPT